MANLMYSRTYFSAIPLDSYGLAGNLSDFTASVFDSLRWYDAVFPLSTLFCLWGSYREKEVERPLPRWKYGLLLLAVALLSAGINALKGGFKAAYDSLQNANYHSCGVPMYTLFGHLYYQTLQEEDQLTPQMEETIAQWQAAQPAYRPLPDSIKWITQGIFYLVCSSCADAGGGRTFYRLSAAAECRDAAYPKRLVQHEVSSAYLFHFD